MQTSQEPRFPYPNGRHSLDRVFIATVDGADIWHDPQDPHQPYLVVWGTPGEDTLYEWIETGRDFLDLDNNCPAALFVKGLIALSPPVPDDAS